MPGRTPTDAVAAFIDPLKVAVACLGSAHISVGPRKARGKVGDTQMWVINGGEAMAIGGGYHFTAAMHFEILDQGQSRGSDRFRVTTRGYMYALRNEKRHELISAHWHPSGTSDVTFPHWHFGEPAISDEGVFLTRAHVPSPRVSLEGMIRFILESTEVKPTCEDWSEKLTSTENLFEKHKSW